MFRRSHASWIVAASLTLFVGGSAAAQPTPAPAPAPAPAPSPTPDLPLFAVEIQVGAKWDSSKPPNEQPYFKEHSANLKRLRDAGTLVLGARYADKGFVVLAASDEAQARAMMDEDPSIKAQVFKCEVYPFNVFYPGAVQARPRRAEPK